MVRKIFNKINYKLFVVISWILLLLSIFLLIQEPSKGDWNYLTPLRMPIDLESQKPTIGEFKAGYNNNHYIGFEMMNGLAFIADSVNRKASKLVGSLDEEMYFDFYWEVFEDHKEIPVAHGPAKLFGIIGNTIMVGNFEAKSAITYEIRIIPGVGFLKYKNTNPILEVGVSNASISVGLALQKGIYESLKPYIKIALFISLIFLTLAIVGFKIQKTTT